MAHIKIIFFLFFLLAATTSKASHVSITNGKFGLSGEWDTSISISLTPLSKTTFEHNNDAGDLITTESRLTGTLSLYLNSIYTQTPATAGIDFSSTNAGINTSDFEQVVFALNNTNTTTNKLSEHLLDLAGSDFCSANPNDSFCKNFDTGNATLSGLIIGTPESSFNAELDLGFISFNSTGNGNTELVINGNGHNNKQITLRLLTKDSTFSDGEAYIFDSNPVPLPSTIWLFLSGIIVLFRFNLNTHTALP